MEPWRLLAHNHWFTLNILGYKVRVCSRCSGYVIGFISFTTFSKILRLRFLSIDTSAIAVFLLLVAPFVYDWLSQSWGLRESNNVLRAITGALMGLGIGLFSQLNMRPELKREIFVLTAAMILIIGLKNGLKPKSRVNCCNLH